VKDTKWGGTEWSPSGKVNEDNRVLIAPAGMVPRTNAETALILSISGLVLFSICTAIPALILANRALMTTSQFPNHPEHGAAKAAQVISWISMVLFILIFVFIVALFLLGGLVIPTFLL